VATATSEALTGEKLLAKAKSCFKAVVQVEQKQRERERQDLSFQIPENQWDPEARQYRKGTATSPGRPMLSVSLLSQPMQLVQNQAEAAQLGVEVHPVSEQADPEVAEIKQGLYRRIERDSNAQSARLWALDRAKQCGRGFYRVTTQWDEDGDDPFDQEISIERILNQEDVYFDPASQKPDCSDAMWCLVVTWVPLEEFERLYPGKEAPVDDSALKAWQAQDPDWVKWQGDEKAVLLAEYWWKEIETKTITRGGRKRSTDKVRVKRAVVSSKEVLEENDWDGRYIPIVPVIGSELQPYDGERIWEGMVRRARDAQKFFNFSISTLVERMAMEPKAPFIGAEGQFRGHEEEWLLANVRNQPYLEYRPTSHEGNLNPAPARAQVDSSGMSVALMALDQARQFVQSATSVYAPSLGEMPQQQSAQSGRAIVALQQQSDAGTSHFLKNLALAMQYEARVVIDLMPHVYDRPGRIVQVLGAEDDPKMVMLNRPHVQDQDGRPQAVPSQQPGGPMMPPPPNVKHFDLSKGKYTVSVSVGKSFQTRLQEGASEIGQILQAAPALMPIIGPTYFKFRDFPGAKEIADLLKKMREKQYPGLDEEDGQQPSPEQVKAQMEGMSQQMQQMQQQLQMAAQQIQTEQAKQQAQIAKAQLDAQTAMQKAELDMQKAQLDSDTKLRINAADNETKLALAGMEKKVDALLTLLNLEQDQKKVDAENARTAMSQDREDQRTAQGQKHEVAMNELQRPEPEPPEPTESEAE
jgi:hypothetical protein